MGAIDTGAYQMLERVRTLNERISALEEERAMLWAKATDASGKAPDGMPYSNTGTVSRKVQDAAIKLAMLDQEIGREIAEYLDYRDYVVGIIRQLPDTEFGVLHRYYIVGMTWEQVAEAMHYSYTQIWRKKKAAIRMLDRSILKDEVKR